MPPPPPLPDELVEEVLLRFPPEEPAGLVRAALVCTRWCHLVSDPGFRRRFREFHRSPPMLGVLCDRYNYDLSRSRAQIAARFIPTTAFPRRDLPGRCVLDARHGRVLGEKGSVLVVWDPIIDEVREITFPCKSESWTAAVICAATAAGACDHIDCHNGSFLVVFVGMDINGRTFVYTYSSNADAWSEPVRCAQPDYIPYPCMGSALVGKALCFGNIVGTTALMYDLELHQVSSIRLPSLSRRSVLFSLLITTEDGGLGLVSRECGTKFDIWSRKNTHQVDAKWERRVIQLKTVFPVHVDVDVTKPRVIGSSVGIIFMKTGDEVYAIDLKTYKVKKVYEGTIYSILPYMSFYSPVLRLATIGEGPSTGASTPE